MSKDNDNFPAQFTLTIVLLVVTCFSGVLIGFAKAKQKYQKDAVIHGAAHWEVDAAGDTTFRWNKQISDKEAAERVKAAEEAISQFRKQ
jgi:hypothetical protein